MHNSNAPPLPPDIRQEEPAPLSHWLAAFDLAALEATTDWMHRLAGGHLLALNWANRLLLVTSPLKLGVPVLLALHAWLRPETGYRADPLRALRSIGGVVLAMAISRVAQDLLPARPRPRLALPDFPFPPLGHLSALADWSSMPSDHAALAFALAAVAWTGSRGLGLVAGVWAALFASLPRLYFGYHYASDLIAGAVLGVVSVAVAMHVPLPRGLALRIEGWAHLLEARAPTLVLLGFFVFGFECLTQFQFIRDMGTAMGEVVQAVQSHGRALPAPQPPAPDARPVGAPAGPAE